MLLNYFTILKATIELAAIVSFLCIHQMSKHNPEWCWWTDKSLTGLFIASTKAARRHPTALLTQPASSGQSCLNKSREEFSWSGARRQGMTSWSVGEFKCQVGVSRSSAWIMWHKCIHMRAESRGEESLPWPAPGSALWECKPSRWTPLICVDCHWWPAGKCFLIAKRSINCFIGAEKEVRTTQYIWFQFYFLPS